MLHKNKILPPQSVGGCWVIHTHILNGPRLGVNFSGAGPGGGAAAVGGGLGTADAGGGGPRLLHDAEQVMV